MRRNNLRKVLFEIGFFISSLSQIQKSPKFRKIVTPIIKIKYTTPHPKKKTRMNINRSMKELAEEKKELIIHIKPSIPQGKKVQKPGWKTIAQSLNKTTKGYLSENLNWKSFLIFYWPVKFHP